VRKDVGSDLLMVKVFCHALSMGMKHGSITLNGRQKDSQWNGIIQHFSWKKKFRATHSGGNLMDAVIWMHKG